MTRAEAIDYLRGAWGCAENEWGSYDVSFGACIDALVGMTAVELRDMRVAEEVKQQRHDAWGDYERREWKRAGLDDEFWKRDPDEFKRIRDALWARIRDEQAAAGPAGFPPQLIGG